MSAVSWPPALVDLHRSTYRGPLENAASRLGRLSGALITPIPESAVIKVGGTNGKGSVCAMLESFLRREGRTVGLFTSPHLIQIHERIRINGRCVSTEVLEARARRMSVEIEEMIEEHGEELRPTFFEALLLIALHCFIDAKVEHIILEAGMGGYSDATAAIRSDVSLITAVGLDHRRELGDTLEAIARDKAGIASDGSKLVLGPGIPESVTDVIRADCIPRGVDVVRASCDRLEVLERTAAGTDISVRFPEGHYPVRLKMLGSHQVSNLATVLSALECMADVDVSPATISGAASATCPGRLQYLERRPGVLVDVAHNPQALRALCDALPPLCRYEDRVLVYGARQEKDYAECVPLLTRLAPTIYLIGGFFMSVPLEELSALCDDCGVRHDGAFADVERALHALLPGLAPHRTILITGCLAVVGQASNVLRDLPCRDDPETAPGSSRP